MATDPPTGDGHRNGKPVAVMVSATIRSRNGGPLKPILTLTVWKHEHNSLLKTQTLEQRAREFPRGYSASLMKAIFCITQNTPAVS